MTRRRILLVLFLVAHLAWAAMAFVVPTFAGDAPVPFFDLRMFAGYDLADAQAFVGGLSDAALRLYRTVQVPLDIVYPLAAGAFFFVLFAGVRGVRPLAWIGVATAVLDLAENALVGVLMSGRIDGTIVAAASLLTNLKGVAYALAYGLAALLCIRHVVARWRHRRPEERTS